MRKYVYAQMLLDVMTVIKRPTPQLKSTARAWLVHGSDIPDVMTDDVSCNEMISPFELERLHVQLVGKPVGKVRGKAEDVLAWIAEEEEFETWKSLPEASPETDETDIETPHSDETSNFHRSVSDQVDQNMNNL